LIAACYPNGNLANSNGFLTCTGGVWVANPILVGATNAACNAGNTGYIRYNSGNLEVCNGTAWGQVATGSSSDWQCGGGAVGNSVYSTCTKPSTGQICYTAGVDGGGGFGSWNCLTPSGWPGSSSDWQCGAGVASLVYFYCTKPSTGQTCYIGYGKPSWTCYNPISWPG
jgi:hypothetical protein